MLVFAVLLRVHDGEPGHPSLPGEWLPRGCSSSRMSHRHVAWGQRSQHSGVREADMASLGGTSSRAVMAQSFLEEGDE